MYEATQSVEKYLNVELECDCGKTHYAPIKAINIGSGALDSLPDYVREYGYEHPYILCDKITYEIAGRRCEELLLAAGIEPATLIIRHLGYDEATLGEIVINRPDDCDLMIGIGTGSITDILRYSSFKLKIPCFTIPTAAPMDGFSASVGIMNVNSLKATMPAHSTEVIIGDTDILRTAPYRMTAAGFGDLIAKVNALNDWHLGVLIKGDHYCKNIDKMVDDYVADILSKAERIKDRDPEVLGDLMSALLLTGASISLYGSSRPISGAEHHMSHYWEVLGDERGKPYAMHGEQAAVGTVLALMLGEELRQISPDFERARQAARDYDAEAWKAEIKRAYGQAADAIIELEEKAGKNSTEGRLRRIDTIEKNWSTVVDMLGRLCPAERVRALLEDVGCPSSPKEIGITADILRDTYMYCKDTRDRYTVYQLAWDLDLMKELSEKIIAKLEADGRL